MIHPEGRHSTIDQAIRSLERRHQLKQKEFKSQKVYQNLFSGSSLFSPPVNSLLAPVLQVQSVLKESAELFKYISKSMQREVEREPWTLLGKVALGSIGAGLLAARRLTPRRRVKK